MKVIFIKDLKGQGKIGDQKEMSDGYARNFLIPKGYAVEANSANINDLKGKKDSEAYKKEQDIKNAEQIKEQLNNIVVKLTAKSGDNGKLFGSITSKDVSDALKQQHKIEIDKKKFNLPDGIKEIGEFSIDVKLYSGIAGKVKVIVSKQ